MKFYARTKVRDLLIVDREPWRLELYRPDGDRLTLAGTSNLENPNILPIESLSLSLRLVPGMDRPKIEVTRVFDGRAWLA